MAIAIIYLLHKNDEITRLQSFIKQIKELEVPSSWNIKLLLKGFSSTSIERIRKEIAGIENTLEIQKVPNFGYDLESYRWYVKRFPYDNYLFLSSSSEFSGQKSIEIIENIPKQSRKALYFSLGSNISLLSNLQIGLKLKHRYLQGRLSIQFLEDFSDMFVGRKIKLLSRITLNKRHPMLARIAQVITGSYYKVAISLNQIRFRSFPSYPNHHIRTTGLFTDRETFLLLRYGFLYSKFKALELESGHHSMTKQLLKMGIEIYYLNIDGPPVQIKQLNEFEQINLLSPVIKDHRYHQIRVDSNVERFILAGMVEIEKDLRD